MDAQNGTNQSKPVNEFIVMFERLEKLLSKLIHEDNSIVEQMQASSNEIKCDIEKAEAMQKLLKNMFANNQQEQA